MPRPQREILSELRRLTHDNAPLLQERVKWSAPWYEGNGNVIYLACQSTYATFGVCNGAHIENPNGLMEGTGKDMRHVKALSFDAVPRTQLMAILDRAV